MSELSWVIDRYQLDDEFCEIAERCGGKDRNGRGVGWSVERGDLRELAVEERSEREGREWNIDSEKEEKKSE